MKNPARRKPRPKVSRRLPPLAQMSAAERERYERSLEAVRLMRREGLTLSKAARRARTTPGTVTRYASRALTVGPTGIIARRTDRLPRAMRFLDPRGETTVTVTSSETASMIADYWNALSRYFNTGDYSAVGQFRGKTFRDAHGRTRRFVTRRAVLDRFAGAGEARFESIYQFVSEG